MKVYCPYCHTEVEYSIEKRDVKKFRGVEIATYENVAVCKKCNQDLYVNKLENENMKRIHEAYRNKTNGIKPQDIINLRLKYNISQRELTAILDFGETAINRYERGGVPTKSQSEYLKLLIDNDDKFRQKVEEAYQRNDISEKTYVKIIFKNDDFSKNVKKQQQSFSKNVMKCS